MNCNCDPPQPAVVRVVNKAGDNQGKQFFTCPNSACKCFHWVTSSIPASLPQSYAKKVEYSINASHHDTTKSTKVGPKLKLEIAEFTSSPISIWFRAIGPQSADVFNFLNSISMNDKKYKMTSKLWLFNFRIYEPFVSRFHVEVKSIDLQELPRFLVMGLKSYLRRYDADSMMSSSSATGDDTTAIISELIEPEVNIEESLLDTLLPFQLEGIRFVIKHKGRALIGDEMGCGKTIQAIGVIQHYRQHWPVLMMLPVSLINQWHDELIKFLSNLIQPHDICVVKKGSDNVHGKICLVPYTLIDKLVDKEKISKDQFGIVIADESHNIKSKDSKRTNVALPFIKAAKIAICLTGTPATNRPVELYTQLNGLLPTVFSDYEQFTLRYCDAKPNRFGPGLDVTGSSNEAELKLLLEGMVMIRRLKADVINNLPTKLRELRYVSYDMTYDKELKELEKRDHTLTKSMNCPSVDVNSIQQMRIEQRTLLNTRYQVTGLSKINAIKQELVRLIGEARTACDDDHMMKDDDIEYVEERKSPAMVSSSSSMNDKKPVIMMIEDDDIMNDHKTSSSSSSSSSSRRHLPPDVADDELNESDNEPHHNSHTSSIQSPSRRRLNKASDMNPKPSSHASSKPYGSRYDSRYDDMDEFIASDDDFDEELDVRNYKKAIRNPPQQHHQQQHLSNTSNKRSNQYNIDDTSIGSDDDFEVEVKPKSTSRHNNKKHPANPVEPVINTAKKPSKSLIQSSIFTSLHVASNVASSSSSSSKQPSSTIISSSSSGTCIGKKIIVFAHHQQVLDGIEDCLRDMKASYVRIDGSTTATNRAMNIKKFQNDDETDVALLSLTACGTGLNLTRANVALFAELYWSPGIVLQAEDRIHRLGQKASSVKIIYLIARKSVDEIVWDQIQKKHNVLGATVGLADNRGNGMVIDRRPSIYDNQQATLDIFMFPGYTSASQPSHNQHHIESSSSYKDVDVISNPSPHPSPSSSHTSSSKHKSRSHKIEEPTSLPTSSPTNAPFNAITSYFNPNNNKISTTIQSSTSISSSTSSSTSFKPLSATMSISSSSPIALKPILMTAPIVASIATSSIANHVLIQPQVINIYDRPTSADLHQHPPSYQPYTSSSSSYTPHPYQQAMPTSSSAAYSSHQHLPSSISSTSAVASYPQHLQSSYTTSTSNVNSSIAPAAAGTKRALSPNTLATIERNKQAAIEKKRQRELQQQPSSTIPVHTSTYPPLSSVAADNHPVPPSSDRKLSFTTATGSSIMINANENLYRTAQLFTNTSPPPHPAVHHHQQHQHRQQQHYRQQQQYSIQQASYHQPQPQPQYHHNIIQQPIISQGHHQHPEPQQTHHHHQHWPLPQPSYHQPQQQQEQYQPNNQPSYQYDYSDVVQAQHQHQQPHQQLPATIIKQKRSVD